MALIDWNADFSVNVAEIDNQHQKLVGMINQLNDAMKQRKGKDVLGAIINNLFAYTATHFETEEKYFTQLHYPDTDNHKELHRNFVKKVSEFKNGHDGGQVALTVEVMRFLKDWLSSHIQGADRKYAPWFNERGLR